ncbi:MAG: hypothetical protein AAGG51_19370 [Cyanobacteria bacterium P01_G01_bin.54]
MTATESVIEALPINRDEIVFNELNLVQSTLEDLLESDDASIPKADLSEFISKIIEISEKTARAKTLQDRVNIYFAEYRPILEKFRKKYLDFLGQDFLKKIEIAEQETNTLIDIFDSFVTIQNYVLSAYKEKPSYSLSRLSKIHIGIVNLSELTERYSMYFSKEFMECIEDIAWSFLDDMNLISNIDTQDDKILTPLVAIKNTARAILWQVKEVKEATQSPLLKSTLASDAPLPAQNLQAQKNQAAMDWAKSQLEQLEQIGKAKGYKF